MMEEEQGRGRGITRLLGLDLVDGSSVGPLAPSQRAVVLGDRPSGADPRLRRR